MKRLLTYIVSAVVLVCHGLAAPPEGRGKGRGRAKVVEQSGAARGSTATNRDLLRSHNIDSPSQTAIRTSPALRGNVRDSNEAPITTRHFSDSSAREFYRTGDHDEDRRDTDRNWSDRRRHHRPPISVYRSWDRDRNYSWNNNRYRWYGGSWVLNGGPTVVYRESLPVIGASLVAEVQVELQQEGYYRGAVDGLLGPRTRTAIERFQEDRGLAVTGRITSSLLRELGIR